MTRRISVHAGLAISFVLAFLVATQAAWSIQTGLRWHDQIVLPNGVMLTTTSISRSLGKNENSKVVSLEKVFLMDGGSSYGRWIVASSLNGSSDFAHLHGRYTFLLKDTNEKLSITYLTSKGEGNGTFHVTIGDSSMDLDETDLAGAAAVFNAFLAAHTSNLFREGLAVLGQLAGSDTEFELSQLPFQLVTGRTAVAGGQASNFVVRALPVDCTFDNAFGYPCLPSEHASHSGKLYRFGPGR